MGAFVGVFDLDEDYVIGRQYLRNPMVRQGLWNYFYIEVSQLLLLLNSPLHEIRLGDNLSPWKIKPFCINLEDDWDIAFL